MPLTFAAVDEQQRLASSSLAKLLSREQSRLSGTSTLNLQELIDAFDGLNTHEVSLFAWATTFSDQPHRFRFPFSFRVKPATPADPI